MPLGIAAMDEKAWIARKPSPISLPGWLRGPGWQGNSVHCLLDIGGRSDYSSFLHMGLVIQDSGKSYCRKWDLFMNIQLSLTHHKQRITQLLVLFIYGYDTSYFLTLQVRSLSIYPVGVGNIEQVGSLIQGREVSNRVFLSWMVTQIRRPGAKTCSLLGGILEVAEKPSQVLVLFSVGCWYTFIVDGDRQVLGRCKQPQHKGQAQENTEEQQEHYQDPRFHAPGLGMFFTLHYT